MKMGVARARYLATADVAVELIVAGEVAPAWDRPSVLDELPTGGLAAHLARSVLQVEWYLDAPVPDRDPITAAAYYARLEGANDLRSPLNTGVRERSLETAEEGPTALARRTREALQRLRQRLLAEPSDRRLEAFGRILLLDEYLRTRLVELVVHIEDLALSLGVDPPDVPPDAQRDAIAVLVDAAVLRHGAPEVLHALTRRERDPFEALRVL
ncbi:MAG: maleylpyruvate isomerase N-terminal domain-containing protein [Actinomycetota bacterium]